MDVTVFFSVFTVTSKASNLRKCSKQSFTDTSCPFDIRLRLHCLFVQPWMQIELFYDEKLSVVWKFQLDEIVS